MIQLSSSISSLSFKRNIKQSEEVLLPEITSVLLSTQTNSNTTFDNTMNTSERGIVSIENGIVIDELPFLLTIS